MVHDNEIAKKNKEVKALGKYFPWSDLQSPSVFTSGSVPWEWTSATAQEANSMKAVLR